MNWFIISGVTAVIAAFILVTGLIVFPTSNTNNNNLLMLDI